MTDQVSYRVGRSWGVTVIRERPGQPDQLVGAMQTREDAALVCEALNGLPPLSDVDVAVESGVIKLYGGGDKLIADLGDDRAEILRDMLGDAIKARAKQREMLAVKGREAS